MTYATTASNTTNTTTIATPSELPEQGRIITSKGCGEGYGYYVDDPNPICEPLDRIGEGPPPDQAFCAALGCPYNPPAENLPEPQTERRGEGGACAALYTYNPETGQCELPPNSIQSPVEAEPEPEQGPAPDPGNEDQNGEGDNDGNGSNEEGSNEDNSGGGDGPGGEGSDGGGGNEGNGAGGDEGEGG